MMVVCFTTTTTTFELLILSVLGFALTYVANIYIFIILYASACCLHSLVTVI